MNNAPTLCPICCGAVRDPDGGLTGIEDSGRCDLCHEIVRPVLPDLEDR